MDDLDDLTTLGRLSLDLGHDKSLTTLGRLSLDLGHDKSYFRVLRHRYPEGFPSSVRAFMGRDLYGTDELIQWDEARKLRLKLKHTTNKETRA